MVSVKMMLTLLFLFVATATSAPVQESLVSDAATALDRFYAVAGGLEALEHRKDFLRSIFSDKEKTKIEQDLIDAMAARLEGTVADRPSIAEINKPIAQYLYGADVMLTEADLARMAENRNQHDHTRRKRGAPIITANKWSKTQPIGFVFRYDIDEATREVIRGATKKIADNTCLSFKENSSVGNQLQFLRGGGCWSYVGDNGNDFGNLQPVSIDYGCGTTAIVSHEISHALGLDHTQNRKDRDTYVSVNTDNVDPGSSYNFEKRSDAENENFGLPYEYGSIMHYGPYDGSINDQPVIIAYEADYANTMGQRKAQTFADYKMINTFYNCSAHCPNRINCRGGGYQSPKDCNKCVCNDFSEGVYCERTKALSSLRFTGSVVETFHQDYNYTQVISGNTYNWDMFTKTAKVIMAPEGKRIRVTLTKMSPNFNFPAYPCYESCPTLGLEFVDNALRDLTTTGKIFCCSKDENYSFVSQTNVVGFKAYVTPGVAFDAKVTFTAV